MRHWLSMRDFKPAQLAALVGEARAIKARDTHRAQQAISRKLLGMVFFNPSLRTRVSFEAAMFRFGGHAITLNVGGDAWSLEHRDGVVMDGPAAEHIKEAAPVLSRYCDALAVRTFATLKSADDDAADAVLRTFGRHATVPVINLESAMEHPCQGLADWMTMAERLGDTRGRTIVVTWAPQAKAVPMAVAHSALLAAAAAGMRIRLAHPGGYDLNPAVVEQARNWATAQGGDLTVYSDQMAACDGAEVVYVKSWGSTRYYGDARAQQASFAENSGWMVTPRHLSRRNTILMHCLPVRRNVVISDAALADPRCVVVDQAENRMWAQAAILSHVFG